MGQPEAGVVGVEGVGLDTGVGLVAVGVVAVGVVAVGVVAVGVVAVGVVAVGVVAVAEPKADRTCIIMYVQAAVLKVETVNSQV